MNFKKRVNGSWTDTPHYIHNTSTDTITTPADIYANSTTATVGLKGNTVQNGTPSPDNPVMPQGTGERTANLVESYIANCNIQPNGSLISNQDFNMFIAKVEQGKTYCADVKILGGYFTSKPTIGSVSYSGSRIPFEESPFIAPIDGYLAFRKASTETTAMMNEGNELLSYEPYGYKIPISSANTTTPVYLGEVESTRKIKKLVLDGTEQWQFFSDSTGAYGAWQFYVNDVVNGLLTSSAWSNIADYGVTAMTRSNYLYGVYLVTSGTGVAFQMAGAKDTFTNVTAWKSYLAAQYAAGTPVCVWYVLATPTTGIVNEPIRKIGDYADELSGISIPVTAGANTISVDTTLQPSEVTVNYKGWHPVSSAHECSGGAWN